MGLKNYFALTSRERNGLFVIVTLCVLVVCADYYVRFCVRPPVMDLSALQDSINAFYASGGGDDSVYQDVVDDGATARYKPVIETTRASTVVEKQDRPLLHIEINTAEEADLLQIRGIGSFYAKQIIKLRDKYGGFSDLSTLSELYGMDQERLNSWKRELYVDPRHLYEKISLNSADTIILSHIPCISEYEASRIVRYRDRLGGFYDSKQVLEVYGMTPKDYEEMMLRVVLDSVALQVIDINNVAFKELMRHPYIDGYENTKAIFRYLDLCTIDSWSDFCEIPNLKIKNLEGLRHYLVFRPRVESIEK